MIDDLSAVLEASGITESGYVAASYSHSSGYGTYANYAFNDRWRISVRAEYLDDKKGFVSGASQTLKEGTVTVAFDLAKAFELRLEARYDWSGESTFVKAIADDAAATLGDHQTGVALQGVCKF